MFERLRKLRQLKGYTCEQMAEKMGLTKATYSKKERGQITMSLGDAEKISDILGSNIDDIFFADKVSLKDTLT